MKTLNTPGPTRAATMIAGALLFVGLLLGSPTATAVIEEPFGAWSDSSTANSTGNGTAKAGPLDFAPARPNEAKGKVVAEADDSGSGGSGKATQFFSAAFSIDKPTTVALSARLRGEITLGDDNSTSDHAQLAGLAEIFGSAGTICSTPIPVAGEKLFERLDKEDLLRIDASEVIKCELPPGGYIVAAFLAAEVSISGDFFFLNEATSEGSLLVRVQEFASVAIDLEPAVPAANTCNSIGGGGPGIDPGDITSVLDSTTPALAAPFAPFTIDFVVDGVGGVGSTGVGLDFGFDGTIIKVISMSANAEIPAVLPASALYWEAQPPGTCTSPGITTFGPVVLTVPTLVTDTNVRFDATELGSLSAPVTGSGRYLSASIICLQAGHSKLTMSDFTTGGTGKGPGGIDVMGVLGPGAAFAFPVDAELEADVYCDIPVSSVGNQTVAFVTGAGADADDVTALKTLFDAMVTNSSHMASLITKDITITVAENDPSIFVAENRPGGSNMVFIDVGDIADMVNHLSGGTAAQQKAVVDHLLSRIIAHEVSHTDKAKDPPDSPGGDTSVTDKGEAVEAANWVQMELALADDPVASVVARDQYCYKDKKGTAATEDDEVITTFTVGGGVVTLSLTALKAARKSAKKFLGCFPSVGGTTVPVGGTTELLVDDSDASASAGDGSGSPVPYAAAAAAGALVLAAGGWYARRRWLAG